MPGLGKDALSAIIGSDLSLPKLLQAVIGSEESSNAFANLCVDMLYAKRQPRYRFEARPVSDGFCSPYDDLKGLAEKGYSSRAVQ